MTLSLLERPAATDDLGRLARRARNNRHDAEAQQAYGVALIQAGRAEEGLEWLTRATVLEPFNSTHWINVAAAHFALDRYEDAHQASERAYALDLGSGIATFNLASLHVFWNDIETAARWARRTLDLTPENPEAWTLWLFCLDLLATTTPELALGARRTAAAYWERPVRHLWPKHTNDPDPERRLRIGFTGGDFRDHSASYCFGPIFDRIDRERFQLVSYADLTTRDEVTDYFRMASNGWRDVTGWDDATIARAVARDEIDILVDLAGFTNQSHIRVHMLKPAPLSVTAWGYLTGTGLDCMDAILADDVMIPPEHEAFYRERVLRVPYGLGFSLPTGADADVSIEPRPADRPLTFGYVGRIIKASRQTLSLWARLLRAHPESRLILKDGTLRQARTRERLLQTFAEGGVAPERIEIRTASQRGEHLAAYGDVDVALDPFPQGGGMTTLEALWMGTPTVTLLGDRTIGRASASALTAVGHPEWVAHDEDEYVEIAGRIANAGGTDLRERFLASSICDDDERTRAFESALRGLWADWCARARGESHV